MVLILYLVCKLSPGDMTVMMTSFTIFFCHIWKIVIELEIGHVVFVLFQVCRVHVRQGIKVMMSSISFFLSSGIIGWSSIFITCVEVEISTGKVEVLPHPKLVGLYIMRNKLRERLSQRSMINDNVIISIFPRDTQFAMHLRLFVIFICKKYKLFIKKTEREIFP